LLKRANVGHRAASFPLGNRKSNRTMTIQLSPLFSIIFCPVERPVTINVDSGCGSRLLVEVIIP
jgi:hypothetical protein